MEREYNRDKMVSNVIKYAIINATYHMRLLSVCYGLPGGFSL